MQSKQKEIFKGEKIFAGIDMHKRSWHITIRTKSIELFNGSIPARWEALRKLLHRYKTQNIYAVYEAGYFGFWLHDHLIKYGVNCLVTPPSLVPREHGNRVKTDRRDSSKLAHLLAKGLLKSVWVASAEERFHRQVIRRRRQLVGDRLRTQNRIKSELCFYGVDLPTPRTKWSQVYFVNLHRIKFKNHWMQTSFKRQLEQYEFLCSQIDKQTKLLRKLDQLPLYHDRVQILCRIPGIGLISAMEILLELQDVSRFRRAEQLAAYVGLTPSQYSSADKIRMGRITGIGKNSVRATLVESAWKLICKDKSMRIKYEQIKARAGAKRAIVAVSRKLLLRTRRLLLDNQPYVYKPVC